MNAGDRDLSQSHGVTANGMWTTAEDPAAVIIIPSGAAADVADSSIPDPGFEDRAYPNAAPDLRAWMRANRNCIRAVLNSPLGLSRPATRSQKG